MKLICVEEKIDDIINELEDLDIEIISCEDDIIEVIASDEEYEQIAEIPGIISISGKNKNNSPLDKIFNL